MAVESLVPRPRSSPEDAGPPAATGAVAELRALVAELEVTTRAVRTLGAVVAAIDVATTREGGPDGRG